MRALSARQAMRCETACRPQCRCRCHGAAHGRARVPDVVGLVDLPDDDPHKISEKSAARFLQLLAMPAREGTC